MDNFSTSPQLRTFESFLGSVLDARHNERLDSAVTDYRVGLGKALLRHHQGQPGMTWTRGDWEFTTDHRGGFRAVCQVKLHAGKQLAIDQIITDAGCAILANEEGTGTWVCDLSGGNS